MIAVSYSRIADFEQCPKMFQGKYVTKEFPKQGDNPHLIRGRQVHKTLERLVKMGALNVEGDLSFLAPLINKMREGQDCKAEVQLAFDIHGKIVSWFHKDTWLRVIFDVQILNNDTAYVIDWKTGKVRDANRDQLRLFAAAVFMAYPFINEVVTAYVWVDHPDAPASVNTYQRTYAYQLEDEYRERSELIQMANETGNWPAKPSPLCNFCQAREDQCENRNDWSRNGSTS